MPRPLPAKLRLATGGDPQAVRTHILEAAHRVIEAHGLVGATTRAIATEADIGAGTLYNYFDGRLQLLAGALLHRVHQLAQPLGELPQRAGTGTVAGNLAWFARTAEQVLDQVIPAMAAAFADNELLDVLRRQAGHDDPEAIATGVVVDYLRAEQATGRVLAGADCRAAAQIVVALCHERAFLRHLHGSAPGGLHRPLAFLAAALTGEPPGAS